MSESLSFDGIARVEKMTPQGMITLRADFSAKPVRTAVAKAAGAPMPGTNDVSLDGENGLCWMSPDEVLALCPYDGVSARVAQLDKALAKHHTLVVDVSDARAVFRVSGPASREVLAKLCPVDLSPAAFTPGMFRRTRMAQVPAAFWMVDDDTFQIVCFRSVGDYVFNLLKVAAQAGSAVY